MAGFKFTTNLDADRLYELAFRRAQELGYTVREADQRAFTATQGNFALAMTGLSPKCSFRIDIESYPDGNELVLERNVPAWSGVIGVSRVKAKAAELIEHLKAAVRQTGGTVGKEKEF